MGYKDIGIITHFLYTFNGFAGKNAMVILFGHKFNLICR